MLLRNGRDSEFAVKFNDEGHLGVSLRFDPICRYPPQANPFSVG
ncbi:hypothetical protein [Rhodoblastus sp.]